jgi:undecaprenyl diphosphate synthase
VLALNYGARQEILHAAKSIAIKAKNGEINIDEISEDIISQNLYTAGIPDPDLLIRTSGECRLSNFLLWQLAYTEFYFTDTLFPDFDKTELLQIIDNYNSRNRRFGGV